MVRDRLVLQMDIGGTVQLPAPDSHPPSICSAEFVLAARSAKHKAACCYPVARATARRTSCQGCWALVQRQPCGKRAVQVRASGGGAR